VHTQARWQYVHQIEGTKSVDGDLHIMRTRTKRPSCSESQLTNSIVWNAEAMHALMSSELGLLCRVLRAEQRQSPTAEPRKCTVLIEPETARASSSHELLCLCNHIFRPCRRSGKSNNSGQVKLLLAKINNRPNMYKKMLVHTRKFLLYCS
jgi:hypothetical protein